MLIYDIIILSLAKSKCERRRSPVVIGGNIYIPVYDLIAALFCVFSAAEIDGNRTEFGVEKSSKMPKWLYGMAIAFMLTVIWQIMAMPFMAVAMVVRFSSSLVVCILTAGVLKKNKGKECETYLLVCTLLAAGTWLEIVVTFFGL